jgi:hypothetical protein
MKRYLFALSLLLGLSISVVFSQDDEYTPPPPTDGQVVCYNYTHNGKKPNCSKTKNPKDACNKECDEKGKPKLDAKCINHCKESMCHCHTKCST